MYPGVTWREVPVFAVLAVEVEQDGSYPAIVRSFVERDAPSPIT